MLDSAIDAIEKARSNAEDLRAWGTWWQEKAGELEKEKEELETEIKSLKDERDDLTCEVRDLTKEFQAT